MSKIRRRFSKDRHQTQRRFLKIQPTNAGGALVGMKGGGHQHADRAVRGRQLHVAFREQPEQVEIAGCRVAPVPRADGGTAGRDTFHPLETLAVCLKRGGDAGTRQHCRSMRSLRPGAGFQNGGIVVGDEILGVRQHDIPGWIAEHDRKTAGKDFGKCQVPGNRIGAGRAAAGLTPVNDVRPGSGLGDAAGQREPEVVAVALPQHGCAGPGPSQLPQRVQKTVQRSLASCFVIRSGVAADRCVQFVTRYRACA